MQKLLQPAHTAPKQHDSVSTLRGLPIQSVSESLDDVRRTCNRPPAHAVSSIQTV